MLYTDVTRANEYFKDLSLISLIKRKEYIIYPDLK